MNQLREVVAIAGKLTEELCVKLSPLVIARVDDTEMRIRPDDCEACGLVNEIHGIRRMAHVSIDRLQYLLNEVQL